MAFGRPPGSSWAAVRRQMAGRTAPEALLGGSLGGLGGSWAALGASLGRLGPARRSPGGPGRLRGRAPGGHFGAFFGGPAQEAGKSWKTWFLKLFLKFFGPGFCFGFRLLFACVARVRRSSKHRNIMNNNWFLWVASTFFADTAQGRKFKAAACRK